MSAVARNTHRSGPKPVQSSARLGRVQRCTGGVDLQGMSQRAAREDCAAMTDDRQDINRNRRSSSPYTRVDTGDVPSPPLVDANSPPHFPPIHRNPHRKNSLVYTTKYLVTVTKFSSVQFGTLLKHMFSEDVVLFYTVFRKKTLVFLHNSQKK